MPRPPRILSSSSAASAEAEPPESFTVESDFVVILAALLCALICVVGLITVARCTCLRRSSVATNKGLKKKALNSLPKSNYDSAAHSDIGDCCAICLAEYSSGDEIRVLPRCGHGFHVACIDKWLGSHSSCPSCRQILVNAQCRNCGEDP